MYKEDMQSYYIKVKECVSKSIKESEEEDNVQENNNVNNNLDDEVTMNEDEN